MFRMHDLYSIKRAFSGIIKNFRLQSRIFEYILEVTGRFEKEEKSMIRKMTTI
jgi:hypothetical protein